MLTARIKVQNPEGQGDVFEQLPVARGGPDRLVVQHSPVLVEGLAAGDVIRVSEDGSFEVLERGGNVCIQVFRARPPLEQVERRLVVDVGELGGWLDRTGPDALVLTVPLAGCGFRRIEEVLSLLDSATDMSWMYGNVYHHATGEPLGWWNESSG